MVAIDRFAPEFRSTHLGASQIPAAVGVSPYEKPIELWEKYRGLRSWDSFGDDSREAIAIGHALEEGIARLAAAREGWTIERVPPQVHPRMPWLVSSRDFVITNLPGRPPLECKSTGIAAPQWREARERWGDDGTDEAPLSHVAQVQTQVLVDRACTDGDPPTEGYVAALIGGDGLRVYRLPYRDDVARSLVTQAAAFWRHVTDLTAGPPEPDGSDAYTAFLERAVITHPRQQRWCEGEQADELGPEVKAAYAARKEAEERYELAKQQAMVLIGDGDGLRGPWGSVPLGYRSGKVGLREGKLREKLADMFREGVGEEAQRAAIEKAAAFIDSCKAEGDAFRVFGPPRDPPKRPRKQ